MDIFSVDDSIKEIERYIMMAQKRLSRSPNGRIYVYHNKGYVEFRAEYSGIEEEKKERFLKKDDEKIISALAGKRYCEKLLPTLEKELCVLKKFKEKYHPFDKYDVYEKLPAELKEYVSPIAKTNRQIADEWQKETFSGNEYPFDLKNKYQTNKGEWVRSRAEALIANMLKEANIPYRYEKRLELQSGKTVYPDFTVMHPQSGELYYIEFFGMMDDPYYVQNAFEKIQQYSCDPVISHMFMFFDMQSAPFGTPAIANLIRTVFE